MARRKRRERGGEQPPEVTRKEYLRNRKDQRERRALLAVLAPVLVLVVMIIAIGAYRELFQKARTPVARVNGETITAATFADRLAYERRQLINNVASLSSMLQSTDPATVSQLFEGQRTGLADATVSTLVDEALIRQEAAERGITVSDEEIGQRIDDDLATQIAPPPTAAAAEIEGTPGITVTEGVTVADGITLTEGVTDTQGVTDTVAAADTPSRDELDRAFRDQVQPVLDQTGLTRRQFENIVRQGLLREKLTESLGAEIPITDKQVEAEYLVFQSEATAQGALDALEAGEDWDAVVARYRPPEEPSPEAEAGEADDEATGTDGDETAADEDLAIGPDATETVTATGTITATATITPTATASPTATIAPTEALTLTEGVTVTEGVTATGAVTRTAGVTGTAEADTGPTATPRPTSTPAPTPTPDPFASDVGEAEWYTASGLEDRLGLNAADAEKVMALEAGEHSELLSGGRGTTIVFVSDVAASRELTESELEQRRESALEPWLERARTDAQIDRFPLEGLVPPEPDWFTIAWEQLVGVPAPTPDLSGLDFSVTPQVAPPEGEVTP